MNFESTLNFSFVLAVIFCLTAQGNAGVIETDRNRLQQLQNLSRQTSDANTQVRIAYEVIGIYNKYKGQRGSDVARETQLNTQVRDFKRKTVVVDGVPAQGGVWEILGMVQSASGAIPEHVKKDAQNLVKSSSKALVDGLVNYLINTALAKLGLGK
ncbi:protein Turandot Z [Drosophila biarmipes]|uniref:protein Turandot Z n=1 Tax=Drosophila biarmipes TaxID=125945 RepID=UPI0007E6ED07|nr:protein Turandot Z [Drosophila biarmipes]